MRRLLFLIMLLALALFGLIAEWRDRLSVISASPLPRTAVVFTGQFDRIRLGLSLLEEGTIDRLFISGVNAGAGIRSAHFVSQFSLSPHLVLAMEQGRIVLATSSNTTIENAIETACWMRHYPDVRQVLLITSRRHVARASLALERALPPGIAVRRRSPDHSKDDDRENILAQEFIKFAATWLLTLLPTSMWSSNRMQTCYPS